MVGMPRVPSKFRVPGSLQTIAPKGMSAVHLIEIIIASRNVAALCIDLFCDTGALRLDPYPFAEQQSCSSWEPS